MRLALQTRVGVDSFPLYWFEIGPASPTHLTLEMTGYLPGFTSDFLFEGVKNFRVKLKRGKGSTLACKLFVPPPDDYSVEDYD